jgi:hypothetical protein
MEAFVGVRRLFEKAFEDCGLDEHACEHALRILRSLVRGFVVNEMSLPYSASAEYDDSFDLAVEIFLNGLPILAQSPRRSDISQEHLLATNKPISGSSQRLSTRTVMSGMGPDRSRAAPPRRNPQASSVVATTARTEILATSPSNKAIRSPGTTNLAQQR